MGRLDDLNERLKSRMDAADARLAGRMAALDARLGGDSPSRQGVEGDARANEMKSLPNDLAARVDVVGVDLVFYGYIQPTETEVTQLFEYVRRSPVVQDNLSYAEIMNHARFEYRADPNRKEDDVVNANAGLDEEGKPRIRLFGGAARIGRVAALSIAAMEYGDDANAGQRFIGTLKASQCGNFTVNDGVQIVNDAGLVGALKNDVVITKAKTISAGLMLGIIAHEAGHLSLGHSFSKVNYYMSNLEVARNREREADSFASSVIATSPFGESVLMGTLLWYFVLASQEEGAGETTHPLSKERFENLVRANPDLAKALGLQ